MRAFRFLLVISLFLMGCGSGEKITLRLNLEKGKEYKMKSIIDNNIEQKMGEQEMKIEQVMGISYSYLVKDVDPQGVMSLEARFTGVEFKMHGSGMEVDYDSTKEQENVHPAAMAMSTLVGQMISFRIDPTGNVTEMKGVNRMLKSMMARMAKLPGDAAVNKRIADQMFKQFGEESLKKTFGNTFKIFPDKLVGRGDSWEIETPFQMGFSMNVKMIYTVKKIHEKTVDIKVESKIDVNKGGGKTEMGGQEMDVEMTGGGVGVMTLDRQTGWVQSMDMDQNINSVIKVGGREMPQKIKSRVRIESE